MRVKAKEIKYQEVLEEKTALQNAIQVLEHQLLQQSICINRVLEDWQNNDENWREMCSYEANSDELNLGSTELVIY